MIIKNNQLSWLQFPRGQPVLDGTEENRLVEKKKNYDGCPRTNTLRYNHTIREEGNRKERQKGNNRVEKNRGIWIGLQWMGTRRGRRRRWTTVKGGRKPMGNGGDCEWMRDGGGRNGWRASGVVLWTGGGGSSIILHSHTRKKPCRGFTCPTPHTISGTRAQTHAYTYTHDATHMKT